LKDAANEENLSAFRQNAQQKKATPRMKNGQKGLHGKEPQED